MLTKIYIIGVIIVTIVILYLYISREQEHQKEEEKIERLERKANARQRELELIRSSTDPCPIPNLDTPRKCYNGSNFECSWNEHAERCDKKT